MMLRLKTEEKQGKSQIPHLRKQGKNMTLPRSHVRSWCVLTPPCVFDTSAQIHQGILWRQKYAALSCRQKKAKAIGRWSFYTKYCSWGHNLCPTTSFPCWTSLCLMLVKIPKKRWRQNPRIKLNLMPLLAPLRSVHDSYLFPLPQTKGHFWLWIDNCFVGIQYRFRKQQIWYLVSVNLMTEVYFFNHFMRVATKKKTRPFC